MINHRCIARGRTRCTHLNQVLDNPHDDVPVAGSGGTGHVEDAGLGIGHLSAQVELGVGVDEAHHLRFLRSTIYASSFHFSG